MKDKRYQDCMAEIVAVLNKYDMGGYVIVVDKERTMFRFEWPTWGVIRPTDTGIRFRSKREDFPSREAQHKATELSVHTIVAMRDLCAQGFQAMESVFKMLSQHFDITPGLVQFDPEEDFRPEKKN
ncbi:hypothetical protein [Hyphomicrobium sp.]|uniref:hypothetical protein n=1 Tax=Hyphomicrobium sp. TaxID=82 RepID=UPI001D518A7F|nr:hypothetical protein [Hyphomicrobium sp.]MBY0559894.1 hypothetical protein [Hyphomicrobium sp.]